MAESDSSYPEDRPRVLVVDDEKFIRDIIADFLGMEGYIVRTAEDGVSATNELERARYDMVISDLKMPKMGGLDLLREVARTHPDTLTVIMTGFGTVETAIDAMKRGAYDYILKPFKVEEIVHIVQRGLEKRRLSAENLRLREALSLYKVSEAITASLSLDEVIATVADSGLNEIRADMVMTWLDNGEGAFFPRNVSLAAAFPEGEEVGELSAQTVAERLKQDSSLVEHGARARELFETHPSRQVQSITIIALRMRDRLLGWIAVVSLTASKRFDEGQRKLLSIDKMDRYTSGHSERVARYAVNLARWLGLDDVQIEHVRHSALMHDIGKIGCVMNLNKTGKLTPQEYEVFKRHPTYGREILDPIKFLQPVIPGVHLHHERWDGRGYPLGLARNDIPLIARIIAVADTYDAMTSDRAYRRALPHEVTVNEILRCSGSQFDPDVANIFTEQIDGLRSELVDSGAKIPE